MTLFATIILVITMFMLLLFLTVNTIFRFKNKYLICPHCSKKVEFKEWGKRKIKKADKSVE
uniref:Plectrovirus SVGII3 orf 12 transmembrane protein n=1 Tax=Spiroplasma citri TaxID=2133 RepID=Q14KK2_SPICI|nr:plectrovirus SVGII3 orf 12 transmembrane protein [Spiroplasma citri]